MKPTHPFFGLLSVTLVCSAAIGTWVWTSADEANPPRPSSPPGTATRAATPVSVAEARRQAEVLHSAMHATLQLVHHRLYREDEGLPLPAAVIGQVFREVETEQGVKLRWLAVDGQAMNSDHKAKDDFERKSVEVLKSGKPFHEQVEGGIYQRAGAITLGNACLKCHVPDRTSTKARTAGLIIRIPVTDK